MPLEMSKNQYMRNNNLWHIHQDDLPIYGTIASQFNDPGMNTLYKKTIDKLVEKTGANLKSSFEITSEMSEKIICNSTGKSSLFIGNCRKQQSL